MSYSFPHAEFNQYQGDINLCIQIWQETGKVVRSNSIPISTSLLMNYITVSPSVNYNERWYTSQIRKAYDPVKKMAYVLDTIYGFTRDFDYSVSGCLD